MSDVRSRLQMLIDKKAKEEQATKSSSSSSASTKVITKGKEISKPAASSSSVPKGRKMAAMAERWREKKVTTVDSKQETVIIRENFRRLSEMEKLGVIEAVFVFYKRFSYYKKGSFTKDFFLKQKAIAMGAQGAKKYDETGKIDNWIGHAEYLNKVLPANFEVSNAVLVAALREEMKEIVEEIFKDFTAYDSVFNFVLRSKAIFCGFDFKTALALYQKHFKFAIETAELIQLGMEGNADERESARVIAKDTPWRLLSPSVLEETETFRKNPGSVQEAYEAVCMRFVEDVKPLIEKAKKDDPERINRILTLPPRNAFQAIAVEANRVLLDLSGVRAPKDRELGFRTEEYGASVMKRSFEGYKGKDGNKVTWKGEQAALMKKLGSALLSSEEVQLQEGSDGEAGEDELEDILAEAGEGFEDSQE